MLLELECYKTFSQTSETFEKFPRVSEVFQKLSEDGFENFPTFFDFFRRRPKISKDSKKKKFKMLESCFKYFATISTISKDYRRRPKTFEDCRWFRKMSKKKVNKKMLDGRGVLSTLRTRKNFEAFWKTHSCKLIPNCTRSISRSLLIQLQNRLCSTDAWHLIKYRICGDLVVRSTLT